MRTLTVAVILLVSAVQNVWSAELGISLVSTPPAKLTIEIQSPNPGAKYDILSASSLVGPFEIFQRGTVSQRIFEIEIPTVSTLYLFAVEANDPLLVDFDNDGIDNDEEVVRGTDPFGADSDGDGIPDNVDIEPLNPTKGIRLVFDPTDHQPPTIFVEIPADAVPVP